jgi:hypothetical protein
MTVRCVDNDDVYAHFYIEHVLPSSPTDADSRANPSLPFIFG